MAIYKLRLLLFIFLAFSYQSISQMKGFNSLELEDLMKSDAVDKLNTEQFTETSNYAFGNVVNDEYYYLGPGDILNIQNLASLTQKEFVMVTPENKILLPRIGEIDVNEITLAEAKQRIVKKIKEKIPESIVYVSLYKPRNVVVEITGNVDIPGTYTFPASYKISTLLKFANQRKPISMMSMQQSAALYNRFEKNKHLQILFSNGELPVFSDYVNRNILVLHNDGKSEIADIEKAHVLNDNSYDPYLKEGDKIFVPFPENDYPIITIAGAVARPFVTAFKQGDKASLLLKFAGCLKEDADLDNVRLILPSSNQTIDLKIDKDLNLLSDDIELEPNSSIIIGKKQINRNSEFGVVSVVGYVKKPGVYSIKNLETTLTEIIEKAGGFNENAYLPLANIVRRDEEFADPRSVQYKIMENFQFSSLTMYDTTRYQIDMLMKQPRVSCDFVDLFINGNKSADVALKDGDIIKIPSNPMTVYVYGQVKNPGYIKFEPNKNMIWYISKAGGFSETANKDGARIIRGNTKNWLEGKEDVVVYAGDEIYVPAPPNIPAEVESQTFTFYASIATTFLALLQNIYWWTRP